MAIHGSSRIKDISGVSSITGPSGPSGAIGPGGTYGRTGPQGNIGFTGHGITGATGTNTGVGGGLYTHQIIFDLAGFEGGTYGWRTTAGTTTGVTGVRGSTGDRLSEDFIIWNTIGRGGITFAPYGYGELFKEKLGPTAYFRNLTISGRDIAVREPTDYMIMLGGLTYGFGRMGITGELLYINPELGGLSAQGAPNTFWSGDQLTARILSHKESYNKGTSDNNNLTQSDDNKAGDPTNISAVVSASNIDGTAVTFSSIFADQFNGEGGTALASGIHFGGGSPGEVYKFAGVTSDSKFSLENIQIGSCCYCADGMERPDHRDCVDHVTQAYCDGIGGNFSVDVCLYRSEGPNCFSEGSCCVNGKCVATSEEKCQLFGGFFVDDIDCQYIDDELGGCPDPCVERGSCCINSECFELSEHECSFYPNGMWFDKPCEDTNCCLEGTYGACCVDEVCYHTTPDMCQNLKTDGGVGPSHGVFWGLGSECAGLHRATPSEGWKYESYYPFNCIIEDQMLGPLENGLCSDGTGPPCTNEGCLGWSQEMVGDPDPTEPSTYCLGEFIDCECEPPEYRCVDSDSCGTLWLANGECWECCRNQPEDYEVMGSCCIEDLDGWSCINSSIETCSIVDGHFSIGSCNNVNCEYGSCCTEYNCTMEKAGDCVAGGGVWQGYSCNDTDCSAPGFKNYDILESVIEPREAVIGISPKERKDNRVRKLVYEQYNISLKSKEVEEGGPKNQCPDLNNPLSCINPGIVVSPSNKNHWIIEVGSGECSCCSPGVCWSGALGDGGIASDCSMFGDTASPVTDCFGGNCKPNSSTKTYDTPSLPTDVKPICTNSQWESNELGCTPYMDISKPEKPVWMTCSCCCKNGKCLQYKEPIPCSECEALGINDDCKCVNGCDKCFN